MSLFSVAGSTPSDGFELKSCKFVDDSSTQLSHTMIYDAEGQRSWTFSTWLKRSELGSLSGNQTFFGMNYANNTTQYFQCMFDSVDRLRTNNYSQDMRTTQRKFKDVTAWYHIVIQMDTRNDVSQKRHRFWINGVENLDWTGAAGSNGNISITHEDQYGIGFQTTHYIGWGGVSGDYFDGLMAETYFCSKELLGPEAFGQINDLNGQWEPKDPADIKAGVTFGNNGFYLPFSNDALANNFKDTSTTRIQPVFTSISNNGSVVTKTGTKKFGTASAYFTGATNQCLSLADNAAWSFGDDASDFTIECWFNWAGATSDWAGLGGTLQNDDNRLVFGLVPGGSATSGTIACHYATGAIGSQISLTTSSTVAVSDGWHHLAFVREGNTWTLYMDGDREATTTDSRQNHNISARWTIGKSDNGTGNVFSGYIDDFRLSHGGTAGAARYSGATYTVPTAAFTPDDSTILLMHMDGTDNGSTFIDSGNHPITNTNGTTARTETHIINSVPTSGSDTAPIQIGPAVGESAIFFTGTGRGHLGMADSADWNYGSGDFTIEFWMNAGDRTDYNGAVYSQYVDGNNHHKIYIYDLTIYWQIMNSGSHIIGGLAKSTVMAGYNRWHHYAFVRNGNTFTIYKDGVAEDSADSSATIPDYSAELKIGLADGSGGWFKGGLDEYRISNVARYTANFTPDTDPFTKDSNTKLLIHGNNEMGVNSFQDYSIQDTFTPTANISNVEYLIVGGGGSGGVGDGGGGGAGGYRTGTFSQLDNGTGYDVIVGQGGYGAADPSDAPQPGILGTDGGFSRFNSITAAGGGGGGGGGSSGIWKNLMGRQGGSGGGGGGHNASPIPGPHGNTWGLSWPIIDPPQGNNGGEGSVGSDGKGGGGGGSGARGNGSTTSNGTGGIGTSNDITGSAVTYAAGGDGDNDSNSGADGANGTGDGGGGDDGGSQTSGKGGHGIVILAYQAASAQATGGQITTYGSGAGQYYVHKFFYGAKRVETRGQVMNVKPASGTGCGLINIDSSSTDTYLEMDDSADFNFSNDTKDQRVTVEFWFASMGVHGSQCIFGNKGGAENNYDFIVVMGATSMTLSGRNPDGGGYTILTWDTTAYGSGKTMMANGVWRHYALVYDSSGRNPCNLYIDGCYVATSQNIMGPRLEVGEDKMIGQHQDDGGYRWQYQGFLDEYRISRTLRYPALDPINVNTRSTATLISGTINGSNDVTKSNDDDVSTRLGFTNAAETKAWKYDFGSGNEVTARTLQIIWDQSEGINSMELLGSNDDTTYVRLWYDDTDDFPGAKTTNTYGFNNATAYRYYKISAVHDGTDHPNFYEVRFFEQVFTPGATPFKDDKDTVFLCHMDGGRDIDPVTTLPTGKGAGTYWHDSSVSSWGYTDGIPNTKARMSLNGSNNKLAIPDSTDWDYGTDPFTWEMWAKPTAANRNTTMLTRMNSGDTNSTQRLYMSTAGDGYEFLASVGGPTNGAYIVSGKFLGTSNPGVWAHLAVQRDGNNFQGFYNGTLAWTVTSSSAVYDNNQGLTVMNSQDNSYSNGMLFDDIRVTKGTARYDSKLADTFTPTETISCNLLIVGGGGGGGYAQGSTGTGGGGGGGGGVRQITGESLTAQDYAVVVAEKSGQSTRGNDSSVAGYTASGGGGGGDGGGGNAGETGGSGGGGGGQSGAGGAGNTPSTSPAQGFAGGAGGGPGHSGGGGGGSGEAGSAGSGDTAGGDGGDGIYSSITGVLLAYAGGGGGAARHGTNYGDGGAGGGGHGASENSGSTQAPTAGANNTGGGGGGGQTSTTDGRGGGSGTVIISYQSTTTKAAGGTITSYVDDSDNTWQVHTFNKDTQAFTPPSEPFTTDADTKLLIKSNFSEGGLGADHSGNYNYWTPSNVAADHMSLDNPINNFCTLSPYCFRRYAGTGSEPWTLTEGNLKGRMNSAGHQAFVTGTMSVDSGKWYHEWYFYEANGTNGIYSGWCLARTSWSNNNYLHAAGFDYIAWVEVGPPDGNSSSASNYATGGGSYLPRRAEVGDIVQTAIDFDAGKAWWGLNGVFVGEPAAGTNPGLSNILNSEIDRWVMYWDGNYSSGGGIVLNCGQDSSFANYKSSQGSQHAADSNNIGDFYYTPPAGFLAPCSANLATPAIANSGEYYGTKLFTGNNSSSYAQTGLGFQPDLLWFKSRDFSAAHVAFDVVRGTDFGISPSSANVEEQSASHTDLVSFDSDGFTVGAVQNFNSTNRNATTIVTWAWKVGGASSSNTDGTITSDVSVNTTAGMSIVEWVGNGTAGATIGHGLSVPPNLILLKSLDISGGSTSGAGWPSFAGGDDAWIKDNTGADAMGNTRYMYLNEADAQVVDSGRWNNTSPTASVFSVGDDGVVNTNTKKYMAYCFHSVSGYSKIGSYTGNAITDGPYVSLGFQPAFVMWKGIAARDWWIMDNERDPYNDTAARVLWPNDEAVEQNYTNYNIDFVADGFKVRGDNNKLNGSNETYIYLAFAESPFKTSLAR